MRAQRYDEAVIQAEVRRLASALRPYRILSRDSLQREAGAGHWSDSGFDRALTEAVHDGAIKQLPFGFYRWVDDDGG